MSTKFLVTGAAGFAGSHIAEELLQYEDAEVISLDRLTYAGRLDRLAHLPRNRIRAIYHDFRAPLSDALLKHIGPVDYIIHNGAESHVARSFKTPRLFVDSNIIGTLNMLEAARKLQPKKFIYVSTDEVFGPAQEEPYKETDPLRPTNPYAATKAGGELLAYSYFRSFGLPVIITRTMNMFGERQHPEKFVPMTIGKILRGEQIDIHVSAAGKCSSRQWLHARVQGQMLCFLLREGMPGQKYQMAGTPASVLEMAQLIAKFLDMPLRWRDVLPDRPVHDLSYAVDDSSLRKIWTPTLNFEDSLRQTVLWSAANPLWLEP